MTEPKFPDRLSVVFENEDLLALAKPPGQPVIPGRGELGEPLWRQAERLRSRRLYVVHRLDRDASGLVVLAKNAQAHRRLCLDFEGRRVEKIYWAAVAGRPAASGGIDAPLRVFGSGRSGIDAGRGKPSVTRYTVKEAFAAAAWLELRPLTGRRHQIRAHLCAAGHPLLGDPLYGESRPVMGWPRLMLHALELRLPRKPDLILRAEPDAEFMALLDRARELPAPGEPGAGDEP